MADDLLTWWRAQLDGRARQAQSGKSCGDAHPEADVWHPDGHPDQLLLADVDADRAILSAYEDATAYYRANPHAPAGEVHGLLTAIKHRAAVHAKRPGYRDEWRP